MRKGRLSIVLAVIGVLALAGASIFYLRHRMPRGPVTSRVLTEVQRTQLEKDYALYTSSATAERDRVPALTRGAILEEQGAETLIIERLHAKDATQRNTAARILGFYSDPHALQELVGALAGADPELRLSLFQGIGVKPTPARRAALEPALAGLALSPRENFFRDVLLLRMATDPAEKERLGNALFADYEHATVPMERGEILRTLSAYHREDPRLKQAVLTVLATKDADENLTLEALRALKVTCPKERYALIEKTLRDKKSSPRLLDAAARELAFNGGPEAQKIWKETDAAKFRADTQAFVRDQLASQSASKESRFGVFCKEAAHREAASPAH